MRRLTTDREAHVLELAGRLADRFAERAGEHDRDNTFPAENWPVLAAEGYLGLAVPAELGGFDADAGELLLAQERLAQGCGACHGVHAVAGVRSAPRCTSCHAPAALPGLHAEPKHRDCATCHEGAHHEGPFSSRATCISCHEKQRDHVPQAQLCQGCHVFAR